MEKIISNIHIALPFELLGLITNYFSKPDEVFVFLATCKSFHHFLLQKSSQFSCCECVDFGKRVRMIPSHTVPYVKVLKRRKRKIMIFEPTKSLLRVLKERFPNLRDFGIFHYEFSLLKCFKEEELLKEENKIESITEIRIMPSEYFGESDSSNEVFQNILLLFPNLRKFSASTLVINFGRNEANELEKKIQEFNLSIFRNLQSLRIYDRSVSSINWYLDNFVNVDSLAIDWNSVGLVPFLNVGFKQTYNKIVSFETSRADSIEFVLSTFSNLPNLRMLKMDLTMEKELKSNHFQVLAERISQIDMKFLKSLDIIFLQTTINVPNLIVSLFNVSRKMESVKLIFGNNVTGYNEEITDFLVSKFQGLNENDRISSITIELPQIPVDIIPFFFGKFRNLKSLEIEKSMTYLTNENENICIEEYDSLNLENINLKILFDKSSDLLIQLIQRCKNLKTVKMNSGVNFEVNEDSERLLERHRKLKKIHLTCAEDSEVNSPNAVQILNSVKSLRKVILEGIIDFEDLKNLRPDLDNIVHLEIGLCRVTLDGLFIIIKHINNLKFLDLCASWLTMRFSKELRKRFEDLKLCKCIRSLKKLSLSHNFIDLKCFLLILNTFTTLKKLKMEKCNGLRFDSKTASKTIRKDLLENNHLQKLNLSYNRNSGLEISSVESLLIKLKSLKKLLIKESLDSKVNEKELQELKNKINSSLSISVFDDYY